MRRCPAQSAAAVLGLLACCVWWSHMPMLRAAENVAPARPARPAWTSSTVKGTPEPPPPLRARPYYEHVRFKNPTSLTTAPGSDRFFVTEHYGGIYSIPKNPACPQADPFIDMHAILARLNEHAAEPLRLGAVFGLTFHPDFATNRFCYLCYTVGYKDESCGAYANGTRVVRLTVTEENGVPRCDPASEVEIITWPAGGHNGGCLRFGPDGCLYISAGDGGDHFPADIYKTGQDVTDLRASIMRIDVDHPSDGKAYSIPNDNPLLSVSGARGEIFAYGLRNVWKMSFDRKTGDLWAGDVGLETWELVCRVRSGDVVAAAQRHPEPVIAGLFEEFVPADQRVKRLGTVVDPATILALSGDASRGRRLYHEAASMQCRNCHMIGEVGREVGPPLTVIGGKLDRAKLLESMLEPSKTIDPKYLSWVVETADGRALNGLVVSKTDQTVVLRDAENKTVELPTAEIEQMEPQKVSLMPEHLLRDLTAPEAADPLAYLESLR